MFRDEEDKEFEGLLLGAGVPCVVVGTRVGANDSVVVVRETVVMVEVVAVVVDEDRCMETTSEVETVDTLLVEAMTPMVVIADGLPAARLALSPVQEPTVLSSLRTLKDQNILFQSAIDGICVHINAVVHIFVGSRTLGDPTATCDQIVIWRIRIDAKQGTVGAVPSLVGTASSDIQASTRFLRFTARSHADTVREACIASPTAS